MLATRTNTRGTLVPIQRLSDQDRIPGPLGRLHLFGEIRGVKGTTPRDGVRNVRVFCACHQVEVLRCKKNAAIRAFR